MIKRAMAASSKAQGYQCEFIDPVSEDYYCKKCSLVAREVRVATCCGESYCNVCIQSIQQDNKPCTYCGGDSFEIFAQVKTQKKILSLRVSCSVKERGCDWCGPLEHLDAHLDPDTGDCECTDIYCPSKCQQEINKKNLEHHLAKECVKRDYVCPYCAFKATYEIVTDSHWLECSYYPLVCPNRCGVTCERPTMEDHMKICRLQQVECEFGCLEKFSREDSEEHMREKAQTHLTMMAATSVKMQQEFQTRIQELQEKLEEKLLMQEKVFEEKLKKHEELNENKLHAQEAVKLEDKLHADKMQTNDFQKQLRGADAEMVEKNRTEIQKLKKSCYGRHTFIMINFSDEKRNDLFSDWKSAAMYTHAYGYKFCIGVDANGYDRNRGNSVNVDLWSVTGEFDDILEWPATARFTIALINHHLYGNNMAVTKTFTWMKPYKYVERIDDFDPRGYFIKHSRLKNRRSKFLDDDALQFDITDITIL